MAGSKVQVYMDWKAGMIRVHADGCSHRRREDDQSGGRDVERARALYRAAHNGDEATVVYASCLG